MINAVPVEVARVALDDARHARARALLEVTMGQRTILDVIVEAQSVHGVPLRQIRLKQLVLAQPGVGRQRAESFLSAFSAVLEERGEVGGRTVGWLIDARAGGRRLLSWLDAATKEPTPWPGFPFAPAPEVAANV